MKRMITLCAALCMAFGLTANAFAADYEFTTSGDTDYYGSTNYEDQYDARYNYGGQNQIDYDIPEIRYGLAQEFLESSLSNPYLEPGTHYGLSAGTADSGTVAYPDSEYGPGLTTTAQPLEIRYTPSVTADQLMRKDGSLGEVAIARVGLKAKVFEDTNAQSMAKGAGHFVSSAYWDGNVALFRHNRGNGCAYFAQLKDVRVGDTVTYTTNLGTKTYQVIYVGTISYTDYSPLNASGDNRLTLITCIADQPSLRLCVQAVEIK